MYMNTEERYVLTPLSHVPYLIQEDRSIDR